MVLNWSCNWVSKMPQRKPVSDTIRVKSDGSIVVDIRRLLAKEHMRETIKQMRSKTKVVSAKRTIRADALEGLHAAAD